jgi:hypothetical protein
MLIGAAAAALLAFLATPPVLAGDLFAPKYEQVRTAPASALLGEWSKSQMSTTDYVDSAGGHSGPSGERLNIRFFADGHFKIGYLLQSALYSCVSRVFGEKTGVYEVDGSRLLMRVTAYTLSSSDTCHPEWNYEKHPPLTTAQYEWGIGRGTYGPVLVMRTSDGKETVYQRETGKDFSGPAERLAHLVLHPLADV